MLPGRIPPPIMAAREPPVVIQFLGRGMSASSPVHTYNFGTVSMGTPGPNRTNILLIQSLNSGSPTGETVASVALAGAGMTRRTEARQTSQAGTIWTQRNSVSASGNLSITRNAGNGFSYAYWALYAVYNLESDAALSSLGYPAGTGLTTGSLSTQKGGAALGMCYSLASNGGMSWGGLVEDTELVGGISNTDRISSASVLTTGGSLGVSAATGPGSIWMFGASFR